MKIHLVLGFVAYIAQCVYGDATIINCVQQLKSTTTKCSKRGNEVKNEITKLAEGEITPVEFRDGAESVCTIWQNMTDCNLSFSDVDEICLRMPVLSSFINSYKIAMTLNYHFCQNNAEKYLQIAENDGAACMITNEDENECIEDLKEEFIGCPMLNDNVCRYLNGQIDCAQYFESCENKRIGNVSIELYNYAKLAVGCK